MAEEQARSHWLQDNVRILVSIGIVILLVMAIYAYSKRNTPSRVVIDDTVHSEESAATSPEARDDADTIIAEIADESEQKDTVLQQPTQDSAAPVAPVTQDAQTEKQPHADSPQTETPASSDNADKTPQPQSAHDVVKDIVATRNDSGTISVTAAYGDSATTLARKAVAQYLAQRNITDMNGAQKIYMEDYLRRIHTGTRVTPNMTLTFSLDHIDTAATKARALTPAQITNLDRYARTVSNL